MSNMLQNVELSNTRDFSTVIKKLRIPLQGARVVFARIVLVLTIAAIWEALAQVGYIDVFLMGSPSTIFDAGIAMFKSGQLMTDIGATIYATVMGFVIGSITGSMIGLSLWFCPAIARIIDPFVVALNGVPKIALAPMIVIWFGTDIFSKIVLAVISTFVVALLSAYQATHQIEEQQINLMKSFGASKRQIFQKIIVPSSLPWIISAFRINIGLALVSVVGGEFISSDCGLGHMVFVEGNLFNLPAVWVGVLMLVAVAMLLYTCVGYAESRLLPWDAKNKNEKTVMAV